MTIGGKLLAAFAFILALLLMTTAIGIFRLSQTQAQIENIIGINNLKVKLTLAMRDTVYERMIAIRTAALVGELSKMQIEVDRVATEEKKYTQIEQRLSTLRANSGDSEQEKQLFNVIKRYSELCTPLIKQSLEFSIAGQDSLAFNLLTEQLIPLQSRWMQALTDLVAQEEKLSEHAASNSEKTYRETLVWMLLLGALAFFGGGIVAITLTKHITKQLGGEPAYAVSVAERIAAGDLATDINLRKSDDFSLLHAIKRMRGDLDNMIGIVRKDCEHIASSSIEIANGNLELSSRTEKQAVALEDAAASMDELSITVQKNSESAQQVNVMAISAAALAQQGGKVVSQVVETMGSISNSAAKIVDIIAVIDSIAFQTNILALNAAVEAARAGEQGSGFAVVATEVRNLAKRSSSAAKEIKSLINASAREITSGNDLAGVAGKTMQQIVESINNVVTIITEISTASRQQSEKLLHTNEAVSRLDQMTQENVALVEIVATAAADLQERTKQVADVIGIFRLASNTHLVIENAGKP